MRLCVIPARGGSKRIPMKNVRPFGGKPIICWSIEAALDCSLFDAVVVSTDHAEIAQVAQSAGALVPFVRPAELADDSTPTVPVIRHAIEAYARTCGTAVATEICCIYPTAPFVTSEDLKLGLDVLHESGCDYAAPVTRFGYPIQRALRISPTGHAEMQHPEHALTRSQDLEESWHDAGQFYWGRGDAWLSERALFVSPTAAISMPRSRVQDIDTEEDWILAEHLFQAFRNQGQAGS